MSDDVFDLAIIGAGPAGMSAAIEACKHGLSVIVFDDQANPGGQIYRDVEDCPADRLQALGPSYAAGLELISRFRASPVDYRNMHQVWSIDPTGTLLTLSHGVSRRCRWRKLLVATGAMERATPRVGWLLPGVRTVGSGQIMLKAGGLLPPEDTWIVGSGPLPLLFINQLRKAGARIAGYVDTTPPSNFVNAVRAWSSALSDLKSLSLGLSYQWKACRTKMRYVSGASDIVVEGEGRVEGIGFTKSGRRERHATSTVLFHEGVVPAVRILGAIGCTLEWSPVQKYFRPKLDSEGRSSCEHVFVAGDAAGIEGAEAAAKAGSVAAIAIADSLLGGNALRSSSSCIAKKQRDRARAIRPFLDVLYAPQDSIHAVADDVVVCRCEGVTAAAIRTALREGAKGVNELKAYTRAGMGPCQGQTCGPIVAQIVANELGVTPGEAGIFRSRPPLRSLTVAQLAHIDVDTSHQR